MLPDTALEAFVSVMWRLGRRDSRQSRLAAAALVRYGLQRHTAVCSILAMIAATRGRMLTTPWASLLPSTPRCLRQAQPKQVSSSGQMYDNALLSAVLAHLLER